MRRRYVLICTSWDVRLLFFGLYILCFFLFCFSPFYLWQYAFKYADAKCSMGLHIAIYRVEGGNKIIWFLLCNLFFSFCVFWVLSCQQPCWRKMSFNGAPFIDEVLEFNLSWTPCGCQVGTTCICKYPEIHLVSAYNYFCNHWDKCHCCSFLWPCSTQCSAASLDQSHPGHSWSTCVGHRAPYRWTDA